MKLPYFDQDKANHAVYGGAAYALGALLAALLGAPRAAGGLALCAVIAATKEWVWDRKHGGTVSAKDFWATLGGGLLGALCDGAAF